MRQDETKAFLGMYRLDETTRINGMPLWVHCEDMRRCIAFNREHSFWHAQRRSEAGEARGFIYRRSSGHSAPSPHPRDSPWLAYTGNAYAGEHSWLEDGVRCVVWEAREEPHVASSTFATSFVLGGALPSGMHTGARRCLGTYRRRSDNGEGEGSELVNGRHSYVHVDDSGMMLWFARWPHVATEAQYTGWYVGNKADLGHCRGFLMAASNDVALCPTRMPTKWAVGRAGPGSGYVPAPSIYCRAPGATASPPSDSSSGGGGSSSGAGGGSNGGGSGDGGSSSSGSGGGSSGSSGSSGASGLESSRTLRSGSSSGGPAAAAGGGPAVASKRKR